MVNFRTTVVALCLAVAAVVTVVVVSSGDDGRPRTTSTTSTTSAPTTTTTSGAAEVAFPSPPSAAWRGVVDFLVGGSVRADGFNDYIVREEPPWSSDPRAAALALFDVDETPVQPTLEPAGEMTIDVVENSDGTTTVTITTVGPGDDSVSGFRRAAVFEPATDATVRFVRGTWAFRCTRSQSPESFVPMICA